MGNSTSNPENNFEQFEKINNILNTNTETYNSLGGNQNYSETSEEVNYTESNANKPYYKEYMQAKQQYLNTKLNIKGGNNLRQIILNNY